MVEGVCSEMEVEIITKRWLALQQEPILKGRSEFSRVNGPARLEQICAGVLGMLLRCWISSCI